MRTGELMNTREVADYLRLKERTVYDLVAKKAIPCSRVSGKWLFPKSLIDLWVLDHVEGPLPATALAAAPVIVGSHDPLLEWAVRQSKCGLATLFDGSIDGLRRFAARQAVISGVHVLAPAAKPDDSGRYNIDVVRRMLSGLSFVLIEWAWRDQGLIVAPGNPKKITRLADLATKRKPRFIDRQPEAGSQILFDHLLAAEGIARAALSIIGPPARNETDVASAVLADRADAGLGIAAAANQFRLGFVPLHRERYDLAIGRRDYFEPMVQGLLGFARAKPFAAQAAELGGYDIAGQGRIMFNSA